GLIGGGINISFGVLFASVAIGTPALVPLSLVPLAVLHWAQRGYAEARGDRARVESLHRATRELAAPVDAAVGIAGFLEAVRTSFESSAIDLVLIDVDGQTTHHNGEVDTADLSLSIVAGLWTGARASRAAAGDGSELGA